MKQFRALAVALGLATTACSSHSVSSLLPAGAGGPAGAQSAQQASLGARTTRPASVAAAPPGWSATGTQALTLANATDQGALAPSQTLTVRIGLQMQHADQLKSLVASGGQIDPGTFNATYAPSASQVNAVTSYLSSQGFSNVTVEPDNVLISATGTAAQASKAFNTTLHSFSQNGATVYANVSPAYVPSALAGSVVAVLGLNNLQGMHTSPQKPTATACGVFGVSTPPQACLRFYDPATYSIAYDVGKTPTGNQTSVAVMAWGDVSQSMSDFRLNEQKFNLPQVPLNVITVGTPSPAFSAAIGEWTLDTTYSSGMAGTLKSLYVYHTTSPTDSDIALMYSKWVTQHVAQIGNSSFGECELYPYLDGSMLVMDELLLEGASRGQTMFVSTGDTGGYCPVQGIGENGVPAGAPMVNYPAASTYVVAVGGTQLYSNADGSYVGENAWEAGGGGVSQFEYAPYWEQTVQPVAQNVSAMRGLPDVAMDAALETGALLWGGQAANGSCTPCVTGGTSLASPLAAGVYARLQSARGNRLGYALPVLYQNYATHSAGAALTGPPPTEPWGGYHDILTGSNALYASAPGYDYTTGMGSFDVSAMNAQLPASR